MLGNYLTTALRLLWRERGYAAINIFGLAVGFCLCLLTVQLAAYQLSVGDFHEKKDRVFRVLVRDQTRRIPRTRRGYEYHWGRPSRSNYPKSRRQSALVEVGRVCFGSGTRTGYMKRLVRRKPAFSTCSACRSCAATPRRPCCVPYTMVLTEPLARRLFGERRSHRTGRPRQRKTDDCEVTGIVGQLPANSLLQFSALVVRFATDVRNPGNWRMELERFSLSRPSCS